MATTAVPLRSSGQPPVHSTGLAAPRRGQTEGQINKPNLPPRLRLHHVPARTSGSYANAARLGALRHHSPVGQDRRTGEEHHWASYFASQEFQQPSVVGKETATSEYQRAFAQFVQDALLSGRSGTVWWSTIGAFESGIHTVYVSESYQPRLPFGNPSVVAATTALGSEWTQSIADALRRVAAKLQLSPGALGGASTRPSESKTDLTTSSDSLHFGSACEEPQIAELVEQLLTDVPRTHGLRVRAKEILNDLLCELDEQDGRSLRELLDVRYVEWGDFIAIELDGGWWSTLISVRAEVERSGWSTIYHRRSTLNPESGPISDLKGAVQVSIKALHRPVPV